MMQLDGEPVSIKDLGALALVNYGHFTSMLVDDSRVKGLDLHLARLAQDSRTLFDVELNVDKVRTLARRVAREMAAPAVVRVTVFDPNLGLGHPACEARPRVLVSVRPVGGHVVVPPMTLQAVRYRRDLPEVKHIGLFGTLYQRRLAQQAGFDDALFVDSDGSVSEGPTWNIGFLVDGQVVWPDAPCLPGVTMRLLNRALERAGIPVRREPVAIGRSMQGAFITNAGVGLREVKSIDGSEFGDTALFVDRLREEYDSIEWQPL